MSTTNNSPLHVSNLSNGLKLIFLHTENDPISACHLFLPQGAWDETASNHGSTVLLWSLLQKGTKNKSARDIAEEIESIGAHVGGGTAHDYSHVSCQSISEFFPKIVEILSETLLHSTYPENELEKEKEALQASIQSKKEQIFTVAHEELNKHMFHGHPYQRPASGTEESVIQISRDQILERRKKIIQPNGAIMAIASNNSWESILSLVEKNFGEQVWPSSKKGKSISLPPVNSFKPKNLDLPFPFEQAFLILGFAAAPMESKDYFALKFLSSMLGGGMSSRLFQSLREKKGLAYDVGSFYPSKKKGSLFACYMGLQASRLDEAHQGILNEIELIQSKKSSQQEIDQVRNFMKGSFILDHQTNSQRSYYLAWWESVGFNMEFDHKYTDILDKITPDQIQKVAQKYLSKEPITIRVQPAASSRA